jgi:diguanylate cyclase
MSKKSTNRKTAEEALRFLDRHMLDPTPSNYTFAYLYLTEVNSTVRSAVDGITDGGVRLTQQDADDLMGTVSSKESLAANLAYSNDVQADVRHQARSLAELTSTALRDAGAFNRDLSQGIGQVASDGNLIGIVEAMIERTVQVERKLAETARETELLRADLDLARNDASRDALTNLPNRRAADESLKRLLDQGASVTVAFCDIDKFKSINDRFGHAVGDRVLKAVAETLLEALEPHTVARFGGEEFVVLLPDVDGETAFGIIEGARKAVASKTLRSRDTDELIGQVTISAGIAISATDAEAALREADQSLYAAKNNGRNCTIYRAAA